MPHPLLALPPLLLPLPPTLSLPAERRQCTINCTAPKAISFGSRSEVPCHHARYLFAPAAFRKLLYPKAALANSSAHRLYPELLSLRHRFRYSTSIVFVLYPFFTPVFRWLCKVVRIRHCSLVIPNSIPSEGAVGTSNSPWVTSRRCGR